jgi:hypothetical protein
MKMIAAKDGEHTMKTTAGKEGGQMRRMIRKEKGENERENERGSGGDKSIENVEGKKKTRSALRKRLQLRRMKLEVLQSTRHDGREIGHAMVRVGALSADKSWNRDKRNTTAKKKNIGMTFARTTVVPAAILTSTTRKEGAD